MDQHMIRSHPNKAVDVVVCQTFWIDTGSRFLNSGPALQNQILSFAACFPLPLAGCRRDRQKCNASKEMSFHIRSIRRFRAEVA